MAFRFTLNTLIYMYYLHCWENEVLHFAAVVVPLFQIRFVLGPQEGGGFILGLIRFSSCKSSDCSYRSLMTVHDQRLFVLGLCLFGWCLAFLRWFLLLFCFVSLVVRHLFCRSPVMVLLFETGLDVLVLNSLYPNNAG